MWWTEVGLPGSKKCAILIQARLNSSRLPAKILFKFFNDTIIERITKIAKKSLDHRDVFIISGNQKKNKILSNISNNNKVGIYFGNENNVFQRFKKFLNSKLGKKYKYIYRVTSDNYLIQPKIIKKMINDAVKKNIDYSYIDPLSHYAGEIVSRKLFMKKGKISEMAKEHVTWDFRRDKKISILKYPKYFLNLDHSKSLTLDTIKDLILMKKIELKFQGLRKIDNYNYFRKIQKKILKLTISNRR